MFIKNTTLWSLLASAPAWNKSGFATDSRSFLFRSSCRAGWRVNKTEIINNFISRYMKKKPKVSLLCVKLNKNIFFRSDSTAMNHEKGFSRFFFPRLHENHFSSHFTSQEVICAAGGVAKLPPDYVSCTTIVVRLRSSSGSSSSDCLKLIWIINLFNKSILSLSCLHLHLWIVYFCILSMRTAKRKDKTIHFNRRRRHATHEKNAKTLSVSPENMFWSKLETRDKFKLRNNTERWRYFCAVKECSDVENKVNCLQ